VWDYYIFATGGGNTRDTLYPDSICAGKGVAADLAAGLLSYVIGPSSDWASITSMSAIPSDASDYIGTIKKMMDCATGTVSGTHPLFIKLNPNPSQYCK
jgi:hypothetical protein